MKKGAQSYTVRDYLSDRAQCRETFKKIAAIGYDSVQAGPARCMTDRETQELLTEFGLVNCSGYGDYDGMLKGGDALKKAVDTARIFKSPYITVGTMPEADRYTADGFKRYAASLNRIAAELKKEGCFVLYHHHSLEFYSFGGGVNGMTILTGETDPGGVFFILDTHWLAAGGADIAFWIGKLKGRVPIMHFKDYGISGSVDKREDVNRIFAEVGEGNINWPPVVEACRECGVEYVIVEQDICARDPFFSLRMSFDKMVGLGV